MLKEKEKKDKLRLAIHKGAGTLKDKEKLMKDKFKLKGDKDKDKLKNKIKDEKVDDKNKSKDATPKSIKDTKDEKTKGQKMKDGVKKKSKSSARTRSAKAGLFFPVGRVHRQLKEEVPRHTRVGASAAIYMCAVMEYVIAEVLELAGNNAARNKRCRISPRNIQLAIRQDNELNKLITATISQGGVVPNIHKALQVIQARHAAGGRKRLPFDESLGRMGMDPLIPLTPRGSGRGGMTPRSDYSPPPTPTSRRRGH